jgi:hypothetical protein
VFLFRNVYSNSARQSIAGKEQAATQVADDIQRFLHVTHKALARISATGKHSRVDHLHRCA